MISLLWSLGDTTLPYGQLLLIGCVIALAFGCVNVWRLHDIQLDPMEPPLVKSRIPFIGHLLGLMWYNHEYLATICERTGHSICTIPMLTGKAYVLGSPGVVQAAFKDQNISFAPFAVEFVSRMDLLSPAAKKAYAEGLHEAVIRAFSTTMSGPNLRKMNVVTLREVARLLANGINSHPSISAPALKVQQVSNTWIWLRAVMTISTTTSLFGRKNNPWIKDPSLVETYWGFEAGDVSGRAPLTDLTDRRSKKDHAKLVAALSEYFEAGLDIPSPIEHDYVDDDDVGLTTVRLAEVQRQAGYTPTELGATYVVILQAALVNVVPTMFWAVMYVFSHPKLLSRLRVELLGAITMTEIERSPDSRNALVNVGDIETSCPLLLSVLRETQRLATVGTLHRRALHDTVIFDDSRDGKQRRSYVLKKGTAMLMSIKWSHRDPDIWGPSVGEFDPDRFSKDRLQKRDPINTSDEPREDQIDNDDGTASRLRRKAYIPFGGGKELCPGRNFATSEILGTLVILILGYEVSASDGGTLVLPTFGSPKMTQTTARPRPDADLRAQVRQRQGWETVLWGVNTDHKPEIDVGIL